MVNPFGKLGKKSAHQLWKEDKEKNKKTPKSNKKISYQQPGYIGESATRKSSYQWEKDILTPLPAKIYGRSHKDKYQRWAAEQGLSPSEAQEFRTWMDSKEDEVKTKTSVQRDILGGLTKRVEKEAKDIKSGLNTKKKKEKKKETEKKKGFWDSDFGQFINPFDDVSATEAFANKVKKGPSKTEEAIGRGANRMIDSATLGALSNIDKRVNDRDIYYNSDRKIGEGGVTDMITSGLGYLVPGVGAVKGARAAGFGANTGLKGAAKYASIAKEGAITGGALAGAEIGIREALNPKDYNYKDNLKHLGIGVGSGLVADPLLHGAGELASRGLGRLAKVDGELPTYTGRPSQSVIDSLPVNKPAGYIAELDSPAYQSIKNSTFRNSPLNPTQYRMPDGTIGKLDDVKGRYNSASSRLNELSPTVREYRNELDNAVEEQYQYLKNSMGKGTQAGGLIKDQEGYVTGSYGRISNNPKWYQDFHAQHGRKPNNSELKELAQKHVLEGFEDEGGAIPAWRPKAIQDIDDQIRELENLVRTDPSQEPALAPVIQALEADKESVSRTVSEAISAYDGVKGEALSLSRALDNPTGAGKPYVRPGETIGEYRAESPDFTPITDNPYGLKRVDEVAATKQPLKDRPLFEPITAGPKNGGSMIRLKAEPAVKAPDPALLRNPKELVKKQINKDGKAPKGKFSFEKVYTDWVDDLHPLRRATEQLGGKDVAIDRNPYMQARLARGVSGKAETYIRGGIYDETGNKVGRSLEEIIKPMEKNMDDFMAYATAKRAIDYDNRGFTAGIKPKGVEGITDRQLAEATIEQLERELPGVKDIHQSLVEYNNRLMDELVDAGVLSEESVTAMRELNPNYIPMFRVQDPKVRGFQPLTNPKKTYVNLGQATKKITGSEREIVNPIESMIKNTYLMLNMAERNRAGKSLLSLIEETGDNTWGRVAGTNKGITTDELTDTLSKASQEMLDGKGNAADDLFKGAGNKVYVYKDGQKVELELQEDLYKAVLSLDAPKSNIFIRMLSAPTNTLRTGAVLSPDFGPVNIFRDQFSAYVNSKYGFVPFFDMFKSLKNVLKKDDVYWSWKNSGGANSVLSSLDREYLQKDLRKLIKEPFSERVKRNVSSPKEIIKTPIKAGGKVLDGLRALSEITEESTRLGEFKKGLKKGATPKEAAFASRDLIDFSRAGSLGRQYNQITAFFNAAVQSIDKSRRAFKSNPARSTIKAVTSVTIPSMVAYYYNQDKEWYRELPQRERDLYWHFEAGDQIYKLPKPFEVGVMFGTTMERTLEYLKTNDKEAFDELGSTIKGAFTPSWIPTAIAPWIEVYANKSLMFDSPIVPRREQDMNPEDQYGPYTSELAKLGGKGLETSPRNLEHIFKGYTGGLGRYALGITDQIAEISGIQRAEQPDRGLADKPIFNRFVVKNLEGNNQSVDDFYDNMDELRRENNSAKKKDEYNSNEDTFKEFNRIGRSISELQTEKRAIMEDMNMDGKEKARRIRYIDSDITALAKEANALRR